MYELVEAGCIMRAVPEMRRTIERIRALVSVLVDIFLDEGCFAGWIFLVHRTGVSKPRTTCGASGKIPIGITNP